jgi:hypothetical protein
MSKTPLVGRWIIVHTDLGDHYGIVLKIERSRQFLIEIVACKDKVSKKTEEFIWRYPTWIIGRRGFKLFKGDTSNLEMKRCLNNL